MEVKKMTIRNAAKMFADFARDNTTTTIVFDESHEHGIRVEWQTCIAIEVTPDDLMPALNAIALLDRLGALRFDAER